MRHTTRMLTTVSLVAALGLAACSSGGDAGDGSTEGTGDGATAEPVADTGDFLVAVEERCGETNEQITALEEEFPEETPEDAIGYFTGWAAAIEGFVTDVGAMEAPADLQEGTDEVLGALEDVVAAMRGAAEEIEGGNDDVEAVAGPAFGSLGAASAAAGEHWQLSLEACGEEEVVADPDAQQVAVVATDYAFDIPEVTAGATALTMTNEGDEPHFMYVVKLKEGATVEQAMAAEQAGENPDAFVEEEIGDSATAAPGMTAVINADLTPGTYAMLCFVSTPDGQPHVALGMAQEFTVVE